MRRRARAGRTPWRTIEPASSRKQNQDESDTRRPSPSSSLGLRRRGRRAVPRGARPRAAARRGVLVGPARVRGRGLDVLDVPRRGRPPGRGGEGGPPRRARADGPRRRRPARARRLRGRGRRVEGVPRARRRARRDGLQLPGQIRVDGPARPGLPPPGRRGLRRLEPGGPEEGGPRARDPHLPGGAGRRWNDLVPLQPGERRSGVEAGRALRAPRPALRDPRGRRPRVRLPHQPALPVFLVLREPPRRGGAAARWARGRLGLRPRAHERRGRRRGPPPRGGRRARAEPAALPRRA